MSPRLRMLQLGQRLGDLAVVTLLFSIAMLLSALCSGCGHTVESTVSAARHGLSGAAHAAELGSAQFAAALDEAREYCENDLKIKAGTPEARECMGKLGARAHEFVDAAADFRALYDQIADELVELERLGKEIDETLAEVVP